MLRSRYACVLFVVSLCLLMSSLSRAALLLPASGLANGGGTATGPTGPVFASLTSPFATVDLSGSVTTDVYANDVSNPFGGLTFVYTIHSNPTSTDSIGRATVNDYAGLSVDASTI